MVAQAAEQALVDRIAEVLDLGYGSVSSFGHMFRTNLGVSPGQYRAERVRGARVDEGRAPTEER